jgi:hypothetical protein
MDRLAEVSEAVWSSVGAPAVRTTIITQPELGPSTKVRKIPDTTNEYENSQGIFCLSY